MTKDISVIETSIHSPGRWSNRVLLLALAGIFFLTFYPFRFSSRAPAAAHSSPFLLAGIAKGVRSLDIVLNILLFVPFGFGISEKLRERGWRRETAVFGTCIAGFALSYGVEFTQQYTPSRQSRWEDVLTNTTGAVAGFILFTACGKLLVRWASGVESTLRSSLTLRRATLFLPVYFVLWFTFSFALKKETQLRNWDSAPRIIVGNDEVQSSQLVWKGTVSKLAVWNRSLPDDLARSLTSGGTSAGAQAGLLASYDFLSPQPLQDHQKFLPDLYWFPHDSIMSVPNGVALDGKSWLSSRAPVSNLVQAVQKTNQFSLEFACTPAESTAANGDVISISSAPDHDDLYVRQQGTKLIFWFRNPVTAGHARLDWQIHDTFAAGQLSDILISYDGSNVSLYVNGRKHPGAYELGPGTTLAELIHRVKPDELGGYAFIYEALIFFPAGALFGMAAFPFASRNILTPVLAASEFVLASWLLERILAYGSGRPVSVTTIFLSLILAAAGGIWINADRRSVAHT